MTLAVYVPSLGRSSTLVSAIMQDLQALEGRVPVHVVVDRDEYQDYRTAVDDAGWTSVHVTMCHAQGDIAKTRHWCGLHARGAGYDHIVFLDDDIRLLVRRSPETWQLRGCEPEEVRALFGYMDDLLGTYAHVGVSAREGNNRAGQGEPPLLTHNTRTYRVLGYQTEAFLGVEHGRVRVMEDFDVNLQLLEQGRDNCCINYWAQGQKMTNAPGGCSTWRTHEVHESAARRLAELHPGVVSLRQKQNKTDADGFGTRTEVTIQWKRARAGS